jgi:hypothetical protein
VLDRDFFAISIEEVLDREVVMTGLARKIIQDRLGTAIGN